MIRRFALSNLVILLSSSVMSFANASSNTDLGAELRAQNGDRQYSDQARGNRGDGSRRGDRNPGRDRNEGRRGDGRNRDRNPGDGRNDGGNRNGGNDRNDGGYRRDRDPRDGRNGRGDRDGGNRHRRPRRDRRERPIYFNPGMMPSGGWNGAQYYWNGTLYTVWSWGPNSPWSNWPAYYGWTLGLGYYIPEGLKCYADNSEVAGEWVGTTQFYSSDDAISEALDACENDPLVNSLGMTDRCRIKTCVRW